MSHKVLSAAIAHIQPWISICRSPGEVLASGAAGGVWGEHRQLTLLLCSPPVPAPPYLCKRGISWEPCPHVPKVMPLHATHCFRAAPWEPDGRNWSPGLQSHCRSLEKDFFPERFLVGFFFLPTLMLSFFPPSPALQKSENIKYWSYLQLFYSEAFDHTGSLFTVHSVSSNIQNYGKHLYLMRTSRGFFSKAFSSKVTYSQSPDWSLAISSPTHTRNTTPTVFSKSSTAFLCDAFAQSHSSLMFKLCQGWLTTQTILSVN